MSPKKTSASARSGSQKNQGQKSLFGWDLVSWLEGADLVPQSGAHARLIIAGSESQHKELDQQLADQLPNWQLAHLKEGKEIIRLAGLQGPLWVIRPRHNTKKVERDRGLLAANHYTTMRDLLGRWIQELDHFSDETLAVEFFQADTQEIVGALAGLEMGAYTYKRALVGNGLLSINLQISGATDEQLQEAKVLATAVNITRHLVNTPANELNPVSYAETLQQLFQGHSELEIEVWDEKRLVEERMNLIIAVGQASATAPRLIKFSYRPKSNPDSKPLALVGKGITFDTGGLDIKPPAGMRLMKKDMGGSAALVGWLYWLVQSGQNRKVDVYLPLAENAIANNAFRPGDVFTARNGKRVEIHNTDAEGRLILADALALASEASEAPEAIICLATLTGAAKIGLGTDIAAYFSTDEALAEKLEQGAVQYGDWVWRLPLFDGYRGLLKSTTADISHCASTPFAGPITAALFLSDFVAHLPFMHLDIYAWNDKAKGALREMGGSGQAVQALVGMFQRLN